MRTPLGALEAAVPPLPALLSGAAASPQGLVGLGGWGVLSMAVQNLKAAALLEQVEKTSLQLHSLAELATLSVGPTQPPPTAGGGGGWRATVGGPVSPRSPLGGGGSGGGAAAAAGVVPPLQLGSALAGGRLLRSSLQVGGYGWCCCCSAGRAACSWGLQMRVSGAAFHAMAQRGTSVVARA